VKALLLDASVILAAFDDRNPHHEPARAFMVSDDTTLATLDLARYEVANVAVRSWREPAWVPRLLAAVDRIGEDGGLVLSSNTLLRDAAELAERSGISVYDASYVVAASLRGRQLVSCDVRDLVSKGLATLPGEAGA
jgi:predicted nucleic acid-binding protein